jgi:thymidylate synthase (FAD)
VLVASPVIDLDAMEEYLDQVDGLGWLRRLEATDEEDRPTNGEALVEAGGRLCYRSWDPQLNPNVTKVREDSAEYLSNVVASQHGSVLEHANYSFVFHNVSRVLTHELVRHRAGTAISQESLRYVRLTDIPFWFPDWAREDPELLVRSHALLEHMEAHQEWMAKHFGLDDAGVPFAEKKHKTSFMRRLAPDGVATGLLWTANLRSLRHVIELRTSPGAEEEIRLVFDQVASIMKEQAPRLLADFTRQDDGSWIPEHRKI